MATATIPATVLDRDHDASAKGDDESMCHDLEQEACWFISENEQVQKVPRAHAKLKGFLQATQNGYFGAK
jgi:hypothetical protein